MSRRLEGRYVLTGDLVTTSELHVGAERQGEVIDRVVLRDGLDRPVLPGTSLAGALRAALRRWDSVAPHADGPTNDDDLWGSECGASAVLVEDAPTIDSSPLPYRHHVALDRVHGTAARGLLFSQEVVPVGAKFAFALTVEIGPGAKAQCRALLGRVEELLCGAGLQVGAGASTGMGRVVLSNAQLRTEDWSSRTGMLDVLTGDCHVQNIAAKPDPGPDPWSVRFAVSWKPLGAVMSGESVAAGLASDVPMLTRGMDGELHNTLPGSALKGALAGRLEQTVRTLAHDDDAQTPAGLSAQLEQRHDLPCLYTLLGAPTVPHTNEREALNGATGAITVHACHSMDGVDPDRWSTVLLADQPTTDDGRLGYAGKVLSTTKKSYHVVPHVALDRWTGGAIDTLLFHVVEPVRDQRWEDLVIDVDTTVLDEAADGEAAWALLLGLLRDLTEGAIPLGGLVSRGLGSIELTGTKITKGSAVGPNTWGARIANAEAVAVALRDGDLVADLDNALKATFPRHEEQA